MIIAGIQVEAEAVQGLLRRQLEVGTVWADSRYSGDLDGAEQAIRESGAMRPAFVSAVAALLEDESVSVRSGAVRLLAWVCHDLGADHLALLLASRPELFVGIKPRRFKVSPHRDLAGPLYASLGQVASAEASDEVLQVLRYGAQEGRWVLPALARFDTEWLLNHARSVVPRSHIGSVLQALSSTQARAHLLRALAPWPPKEAQSALAKDFWKNLSDAERPELRRILES